MARLRVGAGFQIDQRPPKTHSRIARFDRYSAIRGSRRLRVAPLPPVIYSGSAREPHATRIEFGAAFEIACGLLPTTLPFSDVSGYVKNGCVVRQCAPGKANFREGGFVVAITAIRLKLAGNLLWQSRSGLRRRHQVVDRSVRPTNVHPFLRRLTVR